ncbi:hypothetical protein KQI84_02200 [bacterium]|nr:hypothetical protein [bacterium]
MTNKQQAEPPNRSGPSKSFLLLITVISLIVLIVLSLGVGLPIYWNFRVAVQEFDDLESPIHKISGNKYYAKKFDISFSRPSADWGFSAPYTQTPNSKLGTVMAGSLHWGASGDSPAKRVSILVSVEPDTEDTPSELLDGQLKLVEENTVERIRFGTLGGEDCVEVMLSAPGNLNVDFQAFMAFRHESDLVLSSLVSMERIADPQFPGAEWDRFLQSIEPGNAPAELIWTHEIIREVEGSRVFYRSVTEGWSYEWPGDEWQVSLSGAKGYISFANDCQFLSVGMLDREEADAPEGIIGKYSHAGITWIIDRFEEPIEERTAILNTGIAEQSGNAPFILLLHTTPMKDGCTTPTLEPLLDLWRPAPEERESAPR